MRVSLLCFHPLSSQVIMRQKWQRKQLMMKEMTAVTAVMGMMMKMDQSQRFGLCPATRWHVSDHTEDKGQTDSDPLLEDFFTA